MKTVTALGILFASTCLCAFGATGGAAACKTLENATWKLEFNPLGGRVRSLYSKVFGFELTTPKHFGAFREEEWKHRESREFLMKKPYAMEYLPVKDGRIEVRATGLAKGGIAGYDIPFAHSDPAGDWRVEVTEIIGGDRLSVLCRR